LAQDSVELFFETGDEIETRIRDVSKTEVRVRGIFEIEVRHVFSLIVFEVLGRNSAPDQLPFGLRRLNFGPTRLGVQFETGLPEGRERMVAVKRHLGKNVRSFNATKRKTQT
jgi:hypothetical protein